jgi:hypothetical protein
MKMTDEDIDNYPNLYRWLEFDFPGLPQRNPKVWNAFKRYAPNFYLNVWNSEDYWFLKSGFPPTLQVDDTGLMDKCEKDGEPELQEDGSYIQKYQRPWYGFTVPNPKSNIISIATDLAAGAGFSAEVERVLEGTVLHELIHWCKLKAGHKDYDKEDAPHAFEIEAYGARLLRTWEACFSEEYFKVK